MDTNSRAQTTAGGRSGGKILRQRRKVAAKIPYDRPPPPLENTNSNNWFTGLVFPGASRMIYSGATKLFSFMTDNNSSSSSSSSSDSEDGGSCDDDVGYDIPSEVGKSKEKDGTTLEMIKSFRKESQLLLGKTEPKWVIEQLLMQETFSREECDKLIEIIKSRVVDCSIMEEGQITGLIETPSRRFGSDTPDLCSKALMEAKNWLEEKKVGSSSKSGSTVALQHLTKREVGSPVDMAKSYMQARPPWASPSLRRSGSRTPSPMAIDLFKEETPFSVGGNLLSSAQKRDTFSAGSWNIQEEIRRVRSKATEDMLHTLPSTRIDLSSFALEPKTFQHSFLADKIIVGNSDRMHASNSLTPTELVDASVNLATGLSTCHDFPGSSTLGMTKDDSQIELLSSIPPTIVSEPNQDPKFNQNFEEGVTTDSHHSISRELLSKQHDANDAKSDDRSISVKEVIKISSAPNANGSASSRSSLSAGVDIEQNPRQSDENNLHPVISINKKLTSSIPGEEICGFLSETSVEIPLENEINSIATGSQDSSGVRLQESTHEPSQEDLKHGILGKTGSVDEKQHEKKPSRYQRKGRGRGRGK